MEISFADFMDRVDGYTDKFLKEHEGVELRAGKPRYKRDGDSSLEAGFVVGKYIGREVLGAVLQITDSYGDYSEHLKVRHFDSLGLIFEKTHKDGSSVKICLPPYNDKLGVEFEFEKRVFDFDADNFLKIWKYFNSEEKKSTPQEQFQALGAELVEPKQALPWEVLAGYDDVKNKVRQTVVLPFKHKEVYQRIAEATREHPKDTTPRAVLFYGPPGTGKTMMGRIVAGAMGATFINVPVERIYEKWLGQSARNLAEVFDAAEKNQPCVLFLDEFDGIASKRGQIAQSTDLEQRRVLSVLLTRIDGMKSKSGTLVIGATNLQDDLDPAIRSRFDDEIYFRPPTLDERKKIFRVYARHLDEDALKELAEKTGGRVGRDIENISKSAERAWAKQIIEKGSEDYKPPLEAYLEALGSSGKNGNSSRE